MFKLQCGLVLTALALTIPLRADDFEAKHEAALAKNAPGLRFELKLPDGKSRFQIGEVIPATIEFSNTGAAPLQLVRFLPFAHSLTPFEVDSPDGATDPLGEIPPPTIFVLMGPLPPAPVALTEKPYQEKVAVNEQLRFDKPGTYRIYARSERVLPGLPLKSSLFFDDPKTASAPNIVQAAPNIVQSASNIVQLEIVPTDPIWAHAQVEAQRALWKHPRQSLEERPDASSFRYLQTREAMQAIIERLGAGERPNSSDDETWTWRPSLIGFRERSWLIDAMRRAIARPDYAVSQGLLQTVALLRGLELQKQPRESLSASQKVALEAKTSGIQTSLDALQNQLLLDDWQRADAALPAKSGRARAMTVHSLLEIPWRESRNQLNNPQFAAPETTKRVASLQSQVPSIYADLPPLPQEYLLKNDEWPRIKSPAMVAPLLKVWNSLPPRDGYYAEFADVLLERILEVAPAQGRALALLEMAASEPRVTVKPLLKVPGGSLPQLDAVWLKQLEGDGDSQGDAALLIGRFGSPAIEKEVRRIYDARKREKSLSSDVSNGLQTYLKRAERLSKST